MKIEFSPGLNIIIGDNATGKTHLLKCGYDDKSAHYHENLLQPNPIWYQHISEDILTNQKNRYNQKNLLKFIF